MQTQIPCGKNSQSGVIDRRAITLWVMAFACPIRLAGDCAMDAID
jgi:hypothetical protein